MWKRFLFALVIVAAVVSGLALTQPDSFRIERSIVVKAPPERVFSYLDDFHQWPAWSPWERLDPAMQRAWSGAPRGKGAVYTWSGNDDVGQGRMEITGSAPPATQAPGITAPAPLAPAVRAPGILAPSTLAPGIIDIRLDFVKPFESHNQVRFVLTPRPDGTLVTWSMTGASPFALKLVGLFTSVEDMAGPDFERGLAQLKEAAEAAR